MTIVRTPNSTDAAIPVEKIGRTPTGGIASETPQAIIPRLTASYGAVAPLLGDPGIRYGYLATGSSGVSMSVKLKMLNDEVVAFTMAYIAAKLCAAEYEIQCADPDIAEFFKAMYGAFHQDFMLQASMAVGLGCAGLIKRLEFDVPDPPGPDDPPVWTDDTTPLICTGFEQVNPTGAIPRFDDENKFNGFTYDQGTVDRLYSLWLVIGKHRAFGSYWGYGRLNNAYKPWWIAQFKDDQLIVHVQKFVDAAIVVSYPGGTDDEADADAGSADNADIAISVGDKMRGGATVAMPSNVYSVTDPATGGERMTAIRQWAVDILKGAENVAAFVNLGDWLDSRKAMGMLLPLQTYQAVKQSALGGPTTSDVLGKLAESLILADAAEIDSHLNKYVFPYILQANFGPDAPKVVKKTTGLRESDRGELFEIVRVLVGKLDSDVSARIDGERLLNELSIPQVAGYVPPEPEPEPEPAPIAPVVVQIPAEPEEAAPVGEAATLSLAASLLRAEAISQADIAYALSLADGPLDDEQKRAAFVESLFRHAYALSNLYDPKKNPPPAVVEKILAKRVRETAPEEAEYTEADIDRIVEQLFEDVPEVKNLDTVEVANA